MVAIEEVVKAMIEDVKDAKDVKDVKKKVISRVVADKQ